MVSSPVLEQLLEVSGLDLDQLLMVSDLLLPVSRLVLVQLPVV
jgi:hypothetical protein